MEWTEVLALLGGGDEGKVRNDFQVSSLFELVKEILCPEMWNIIDGWLLKGEGEFYFKGLSVMN